VPLAPACYCYWACASASTWVPQTRTSAAAATTTVFAVFAVFALDAIVAVVVVDTAAAANTTFITSKVSHESQHLRVRDVDLKSRAPISLSSVGPAP